VCSIDSSLLGEKTIDQFSGWWPTGILFLNSHAHPIDLNSGDRPQPLSKFAGVRLQVAYGVKLEFGL
jgi:hypothetical protein